MTEAAPGGREPRVLFVLSNDHGELFNALYFLAGTPVEPALLLPPKLYALNRQGVGVPAAPYTTVDDVLAAVDRARPDLVLLFSGYLYVVNRILDLAGFDELLAGLRERGVRVATSDPSVGVLSRVGPDSFDPRHPGREWLLQLCPLLTERLRADVHLYLAPEVETALPHRSYFNPRFAPDASGMARIAEALRAWGPIDAARPRWLFVLSPEDYDLQLAMRGRAGLLAMLTGRLRDAAAAGRQPILVAPRPCIAALRQGDEPFGGLVALASCSFPLFVQLLFESEAIFYWNAFSASILGRILVRRPFFVFDRGHLALVMPAFAEAAQRHFYAGCRLAQLDPQAPLEPERLAALAAAQGADVFDPVWANLSRSPAPEAVVAELLRVGSGGTPAGDR